MPYAQFDDRYDDHRKTKRAWRTHPAAVGLHAMAITYCNRHKTDGRLDADWVEEKLALSPLAKRQQQATLAALLDLGLFERDGDDYLVHDFLDWNRSRAQRQALAEQGRRGGQAKAAAHAKPPDGDGSGPGSSDGYSEGQAPARPSPSNGSSTPRHATPTPRQEANGNAELRSAVIEVFAYWQERCHHQQAAPSDDRLSKIRARLRERQRFHHGDLHAAILDCRRAVDGAACCAYVDERGKRHDGIELVFRNNAKLEDFMGRAELPAPGPAQLRVVGGRQSAGDLIDKLRAAEEAS
ncbi:MAG TPA: hypothetical protein VFH80_09820 [Solirubrobacteraceae bacterium]|nr:hypothetical protein [Solirubrobacteraceae bacterium]